MTATVGNLRDAKKAQAVARKATTTKARAAKATTPTTVPKKAAPNKTPSCSPRRPGVARKSGTWHRLAPRLLTWRTKATKPRPKAGQIWKLFTDKERAQTWADTRNAEGYDAIVSSARAAKLITHRSNEAYDQATLPWHEVDWWSAFSRSTLREKRHRLKNRLGVACQGDGAT